MTSKDAPFPWSVIHGYPHRAKVSAMNYSNWHDGHWNKCGNIRMSATYHHLSEFAVFNCLHHVFRGNEICFIAASNVLSIDGWWNEGYSHRWKASVPWQSWRDAPFQSHTVKATYVNLNRAYKELKGVKGAKLGTRTAKNKAEAWEQVYKRSW